MPIFTDGKIQASGSFFIGNEETDQHVTLGHMAHTGTLVVSGTALNHGILAIGADPSFFNRIMSVSTAGHTSAMGAAVGILANDIPGYSQPNGLTIVRNDNHKFAAGSLSFIRSAMTGAVGLSDNLGQISVFADDGTDLVNAGTLTFKVDGAVDTDDVPTSFTISVNPGDGTMAFPMPRLHIASTGRTSIGNNFSGATQQLHVYANDASNWAAKFQNDGDHANRAGIVIQAGADDASGNTNYLMALDGDGGAAGSLGNSSGTFALADLSDARIKKNIRDTSLKGLETILATEIKDFELKKNNISKTGLIAQDLKKVYPAAVVGEEDDLLPNGDISPMAVAYSNLIPVLIKSIQELSEKVAELEEKLSNN